MNMPFSPDKTDMLLKLAGKKLGRDPETLKNQLQSGQLENLGINPQQQQQIGQLLQNPQAMAQFFEQPQIKQMLEQLMKGR